MLNHSNKKQLTKRNKFNFDRSSSPEIEQSKQSSNTSINIGQNKQKNTLLDFYRRSLPKIRFSVKKFWPVFSGYLS